MFRKSLRFVIYTIASLLLFSSIVFSQAPAGYYAGTDNLKGNDLRIALFNIIKGHTVVSYDDLWDVFKTSDVRGDGKVWDMYSTCVWTVGKDHCGNQSKLCDCINKEHSLPKSWWGGSKNTMYSDAFHLYPTDGRVNNHRSNFPFGECANGVKIDNDSRELGRLGNSTFSGYSDKVFEPDDDYKGDFARSYFYMATRYADQNFTSSNGSVVFTYSSSSNPKCGLTTYAINLFLKWHRADPVSQKEIDRNNAVYKHQKNRNPFIDNPEFADKIWDPNYVGTNPTLSITSPQNGANINVSEIEVVFTVSNFTLGTDGKVAYNLNSGSFNYTVSSPIKITNLTEGNNTIMLKLTNMSGVDLDVPVSKSLSVKYNVPDLQITSPQDGVTVKNNQVNVVFSTTNFRLGTDGKVAYNLNDGNFDYTTFSPVTITNLEKGDNIITLKLTDMAGIDILANISKSITVNYDDQSFVSSLSSSNMSIFPNPAKDIIKIEVSDSILAFVDVYITDITGKVIFHDLNFDINNTIDISNKESGMYFVLIKTSSGKTYSQKFVVY